MVIAVLPPYSKEYSVSDNKPLMVINPSVPPQTVGSVPATVKKGV